MTSVLDPRTPPGASSAPSAARSAWRAAASLAAAALLLGGLSQMITVLAHEEHDLVRTFPADAVVSIDVALDSGSAVVTAGDVTDITVTAHISDGLRSTGHSEEIVGDRLVLRGSCPAFLSSFCEVDYRVVVPADVGVIAEMEDGSLSVTGTTGGVDASSENGAIDLLGVEGDIDIESANGAVHGQDLLAGTVVAATDNGSIDLAFIGAPDAVSAESANGSITLRLPEVTGAYRVEMETDNGSTELGVATDPASDRLIRALSDNGSVRVVGLDAPDR
ncbi:MAG TPA: DUF4097 family beta strand repeat-containing protein [Acidimicrobiales bacterium]